MNENMCEYYQLGNVTLASGKTLSDARLAFARYGSLNAARDNAVLVLTHFGGSHSDCQHLVGADCALDPGKYFIVIANLFGNGMSTSPSHGLGPAFPVVSMADNVQLQYRMLTDYLGIHKLALVTGHSMGALASYHWVAMFPDFVERAAPICGAARISDHNWVFLEGLGGVLTADPAWNNGHYENQPIGGLTTMARTWAAWPPSSHFYRENLYQTIGYASLNDYLTNYWEKTYCRMDANNILAQFETWKSANIGANELYDGDFEKALGAIRAKVFVMPSTTDVYFPVEDSRIEVSHTPNAELRPIKTKWGHWAGSGRNPADNRFIYSQIVELLNI